MRRLGVDSIDSLKIACELGHVAPLSGFGEKVNKNISKESSYSADTKVVLEWM